MAENINVVVVSGHLVADAKLDHVGQKETAILKFAIGNNRGYGDYAKVNFFDVKFWGKGGEAIEQYMVKGKKVTIAGEIEQERWETDDGKRSKIVIKAMSVELGGGKREGGETEKEIKNDDIPF